MSDVLDLFIEKFVLCGSCRNPETFMVPSKGQVKLRCISCGNETVCDPKHKLSDYVLKDAARRKLKAKQEAMAAMESKGSKKKSSKKSSKSKKAAAGEEDDEELEWSVDVSSAAVKARRRAALGITDEADGSADKSDQKHRSPEDDFNEYVLNGSGELDMNRLRQLRDALRLAPAELASRVANAIFDPEQLTKQIIPKAKRWAPFFAENRKNQDALITEVVEMSLVKEDTLLPKLATVLKGLYDEDYVEEEAILDWYSAVPVEDQRMLKAKLKVAPLAKWFQDADDES